MAPSRGPHTPGRSPGPPGPPPRNRPRRPAPRPRPRDLERTATTRAGRSRRRTSHRAWPGRSRRSPRATASLASIRRRAARDRWDSPGGAELAVRRPGPEPSPRRRAPPDTGGPTGRVRATGPFRAPLSSERRPGEANARHAFRHGPGFDRPTTTARVSVESGIGRYGDRSANRPQERQVGIRVRVSV